MTDREPRYTIVLIDAAGPSTPEGDFVYVVETDPITFGQTAHTITRDILTTMREVDTRDGICPECAGTGQQDLTPAYVDPYRLPADPPEVHATDTCLICDGSGRIVDEDARDHAETLPGQPAYEDISYKVDGDE